MALLWIDAAKSNLQTATNSYAEIQRQLDRYNKVFETYSNANPETQMRAASVMRQALNEYNGLKAQQVENALKIFEAQQRVNYYRKNVPENLQTSQAPQVRVTLNNEPTFDVVKPAPTEEIAVVAMETPWELNNNVPTTNVEVNAIDTNQTMNVSTPVNTQKATINPTTPVWVTKIINAQTPQYPNTTLKPVDKPTYNISANAYGPGNVVSMPGTWRIVPVSAITTTKWRTQGSTLGSTLNKWVRKWATYLYNYLNR